MFKIIGADQKEYGPISAEQLRQWIREGRANAQTMVQVEGAAGWKPLSTYPEFAGSFGPPPLVAGQPTGVPLPSQDKVPNYLVQSILCTLCCCLPFGIVAIVFAAQVNSKLAAGDYQGAVASSKNARLWCWLSVGVGLLLSVSSIPAILRFVDQAMRGMPH